MNGNPGQKIFHAWGLRQGDPLSPMLFLLVIEVLGALIHKADAWSLLQSFPCRLSHRASLYTDDLIVFISPDAKDIQMARIVLSIIQEASGLTCNMAKCQMALIRCNGPQIQLAVTTFPCQVVAFLVTYLGIPLSVSKLSRLTLIPLLDRAAKKLPTWKGMLMHRSACLALINSTMSAIPIYSSIAFGWPPWIIKLTRKLMSACQEWTSYKMVSIWLRGVGFNTPSPRWARSPGYEVAWSAPSGSVALVA
jgi:hypothetical protein